LGEILKEGPEESLGRPSDEKLLFKEECYQIQGAIFEVYREMGCGFLESVYQECLERELTARGIPYKSQVEITIAYKDEPLKQAYKADFICFDKIIIEIKAVKEVVPEHRSQVHNYLKGSGLQLGLLVNFGHFPKATVERIIKQH
jgi:GxxExxY protein